MGPNNLDLTELVRSLQRTEGNQDCFRRGYQDCQQTDCSWRPYCLAAASGPSGGPDGSGPKS